MRDIRFRILFAVAAVAALAGCSSEPKVAASAPESVTGLHVLQVQQAEIPDILQATGTVRSWRTAPLAAQVMADVITVNVREGDAVRRGQVLITMDPSQYRASVDRGQAALESAEHEIASAQSDLDLAKSDYKRLDYLYKKDIISAREYDQAKAKVDSTTARLALAKANREEAAAALGQNKILLGYTKVLAPFDGVVTERRVDPGALATPGTPLLTVEEAGHYRLEATVDERDLKYVHLGENVPVQFDAFNGAPLMGKVVQIVPAADAASRSFVVKLDLPANPGLRSGLFGRAAFSRGLKQAIAVPRTAVLDRGQLQSVYVLGDDNIATLRYVTLGTETQGHVEVLSGLMPAETIVTDPDGRDLAGKRIEAR
ncbi:MAG: efflux RND transporter periplasmic adaptor subunit [Actinomycetota bacterium]